jgi:flagellar motor switch protein FliG
LKVPASGEGGKESSYRKVAKFLLLIGVDEAAKVIAKLTPEQTEKVVLELASIRSVDKDEASVVLAEFDSLLKQAREPSGGVETARTILEAAFGPERAEAMLLKAVPDAHGRPFDYLDDIDPDRLSRLIVDELPAVKALVLSQIKPKLAADVIKLMGEDEKKETVMRLAKLKAINPDVLRRVDDTMREKVLSLSTTTSDSIDGRSALAEILKRMDGASEQSILSNLSDSDPDLGKNLRERLFTVDDIVAADDRFVQETLRPMSEHDLAVLVAGKGENFRNKIFGNMSKTRGALVLEEEKIVSPVTRAESEKVTSLFFSVMRRGWEEGKFYIAGRSDKEVWV